MAKADGEGRWRRANEENETLDEMNKTRRPTRRVGAEMIRRTSKQRDDRRDEIHETGNETPL